MILHPAPHSEYDNWDYRKALAERVSKELDMDYYLVLDRFTYDTDREMWVTYGQVKDRIVRSNEKYAHELIETQEQEIAKQRDLIELQREVLDVQRKQIADLRMAYELLRMANSEMSWKIEFERNQPNEREEW